MENENNKMRYAVRRYVSVRVDMCLGSYSTAQIDVCACHVPVIDVSVITPVKIICQCPVKHFLVL